MLDWQENIAKENYQLFLDNRAARLAWERDAIRFENFRYGQHFSPAEEAELLAFRQAPLPISLVTSICDTAESLMLTSQATVKVAPIINPYDEEKSALSKRVAQIYDYLVTKSWYDSLGSLQYDRVIKDSSNVGVGYFYVRPVEDFGEFNVKVERISWKYVFPHKLTQDPFFSDMENVIIAMETSKQSAYRLLKSHDDEISYKTFEEEFCKNMPVINLSKTGRYMQGGRLEEKVPIFMRLVLEEQESYIVIPTGETNETFVKSYFELPDVIKKGIAKGEYTYRKRKNFFLTEYFSIGNRGYKKSYPVRKPNLVPLYYDYRDNPYPYGRVWYLYPLQRAFNKFIMIAILNGSLVNATRILAEENSIFDENEFRKNFAVPGGKIIYRLPHPGISKPPEIIEGKPLGDAWLQTPRYLAYLMEYVSGIFSIMMGNPSEAPNVFSTVAALQSAGGQRIRRRMLEVNASLSVLGSVIAEFYKEYAPLNGYSTKIKDTGDLDEPVKYNVLVPDEEDKTKIKIDPATDLSIGYKEVRFTTQSSTGYEAGTEAALLTNLATQLKVPQLVPLILKRLNISDVDKIMSQMDMVEQQGQMIQQLQQTVKDLESRTKILANQVTQKSFEVSKAQFDKAFTKILAEAKSNPAYLAQLIEQSLQGENYGQQSPDNGTGY